MSVELFGRGVVLGFAIAAPVGPIGLLCLRRTLDRGWRLGVVSGMGAACADAIYGACAAFGLTLIASFVLTYGWWLPLVGGCVLCYIGVKTMRRAPTERAAAGSGEHLWAAFASTLGLTLTNPLTILSFTAIFAGIGVVEGGAGWLIAGVWSGSMLWWLILSSVAAWGRHLVNRRVLRLVDRLAGGCLLIWGLVMIVDFWLG